MVAGRLTNKRGIYHIVLSYKDSDGKRKEKWFSTGLSVTGSKKKAENILIEYRTNFDIETEKFKDEKSKLIPEPVQKTLPSVPITMPEQIIIEPPILVTVKKDNDVLFSDYLITWLEKHKVNIVPRTYDSYKQVLQSTICPYFKDRGITLKNLTADDIEEFYEESLEKVSANSIKHYHANIRKALQTAFVKGLIVNNPADKVALPRIKQYIGDYYNSDELLKLLECVLGEKIELAVLLASYYGLRRSEILGLKWDAIDFTYKTITIKHTVTSGTLDGKEQLFMNDRGKTKKSYRTLPLLPEFEEILIGCKKQIEKNKVWMGESYNIKYSEYVYVDELGELIKPDYITRHFQIVLQNNNFRKIRFHDLRHSCATLLRHEGVPMENIQKWLGHSNITTTVDNQYGHTQIKAKSNSQKSMYSTV